MTSIPGFWAVVPAGGAGTRLWPLSRAGHPKFLLDLTGSGRSLLQTTVDRLAPLTAERVVVVTGAAHADAVRDQLPGLGASQVLAEPSPRDSMAAIGLAAAVIERRDPDAVIGSFAADHVIPDQGAFEAVIREAAAVARDGHLVTIGVEPTWPATGFGYIRAGEALPGVADRPARGRVRREAGCRAGRAVRRLWRVPLERRHVRGSGRDTARPAGAVAPRADAAGCGPSPPSRRGCRRCGPA